VTPERLHVSDGKVIGPGGKKASYGELAQAAAQLPVPKR